MRSKNDKTSEVHVSTHIAQVRDVDSKEIFQMLNFVIIF